MNLDRILALMDDNDVRIAPNGDVSFSSGKPPEVYGPENECAPVPDCVYVTTRPRWDGENTITFHHPQCACTKAVSR